MGVSKIMMESKTKRVKMILTNRFDPDVRVYKEAKYLVEKGFDVEILCWDRENEYKDRETEVIDGISIKRFFPYAKYGTGLKQIKSYIRFLKECKGYLKGQSYDYLHCHDLDGVIVGYVVKGVNIKLVFDMHEFYEALGHKQKIKYMVRSLVNYMQSRSDFIIYVNKLQTDVMSIKNIKKIIFLPNYPEASNYVGAEKGYSNKLRISYIGAVRQFNELKNLMDACKDIKDVQILIHGSGVDYKRINNIKNDYKNVKVTGVYHFKESAKLYSKSDILYALYPIKSLQYRMSYPVKLFEAIITKTPIIVSKGTVLEEFVKQNSIGFVVDGSNVEEIKSLVNSINKNRNILDEKSKSLERIQFDYSWEEVVKNLDKVYES